MDRSYLTLGARVVPGATAAAILRGRVALFFIGALLVIAALVVAVTPPIIGFALAALLACVWCAWLERQEEAEAALFS
jgi:hypothetical protein